MTRGHRPVWRGLILSREDLLRRTIIQQLTCDSKLEIEHIETQFSLDFHPHFADEMEGMKPLQADGLVDWQGKTLVVTDLGRLFVRCVCQVFDQYLAPPAPAEAQGPRHSTAT